MKKSSNSKVWYDVTEGIGRVYLEGVVTKEVAHQLEEQCNEMKVHYPEVNWLDDLQNLEHIDRDSLLVFLGIFKELKTSKIAVVGSFGKAIPYSDFLFSFIKRSVNWKYFDQEDEALLWLKM